MIVRARWLIPAVAVAGGAFLYLSRPKARPPAVKKSPPMQTFYASETTSLGLSAKRQGRDLVLSWNRDAPAIISAVSAIIGIQTGDNSEDFVLGSQDLRSGTFVHKSTANHVNVRLHVFDSNDGQTNDSFVLSVTPKSSPLRVSPPRLMARSAIARAGENKNRRSLAALVPSQSETSTLPQRPQSSLIAVRPENSEPRSALASPFLLETPPSIGPLSVLPPPAVPGLDGRGVPSNPLSYSGGSSPGIAHSTPASPLARVIASIPLVKKLRRDSDFVPPTPSLSPLPRIPADLRRRLTGVISVDVKVFVNSIGDVQYAELLTNGRGADREIASLAVFESRRWKFHPAQMRGEPASGEVILHYRFGPSTEPTVRLDE
jgi:hypothetical protein